MGTQKSAPAATLGAIRMNSSPVFDPTPWAGFFTAMASAAAALTGLVFVAVSINLRNVIGSPNLVSRSAKALITLIGAMIVALLCLVPGETQRMLGLEIAIFGVVWWVVIVRTLNRANRNNAYVTRKHIILQALLTHGSAAPIVASGVSLILGRGGGLYWLVAGTIVCLLAAMADAWVLMIEILR
jgi:hypothetical protein